MEIGSVMTARKTRLCLLVLSFIALTGCNVPTDATSAVPTPAFIPPTESVPAPSALPAGPSIPAGWSTYRSEAIGFEISYPPTYEALDDADSLSGWINGVVLLYNGGQSYDIAIQVWDSAQEYQAALGVRAQDVAVYPAGSRFITVMSVTQEPENAAVIATFRLL